MQLSKRCEYAIRALLAVALAHESGREHVALSELSREEHIPLKFLEQILTQLRKAGYLHSRRGPNGGYWLGRPASEIHFGDIVRLIDGPLAPVRCASQTAYRECNCPSESRCGLHMMMCDVRNAISAVMDRTSLEVMVGRMKAQISKEEEVLTLIAQGG